MVLYSDVFSWGFVNNTCDIETINSDYRLYWHTKQTFGGYRCGSNWIVNFAMSHERNIYHAN